MQTDIRVGLIGYGLGGAIFHAPLISTTPGLALSAIVTNDPARRAQAEAAHPGVHLARDVDALIHGRTRVDVIVIASPNRLHAGHAAAALDAGLDVVIDKPMATTADEARALIARAEAAGRLLTVFQNRRWDGDMRTVQRLLHEQRLGAIHRFESRFERWRPVPRATWREQGAPEDAGGLLFDLGSHLIDQAVQLFGDVSLVYAEVDSRREGAVVDDDVFIALTHANGVRSHLWTTQLAASPGPRFVVRGQTGSYEKWGLDVQEEALKRGERPGGAGWGAEPESAWGTLHDGVSESRRSRPSAATTARSIGSWWRRCVTGRRCRWIRRMPCAGWRSSRRRDGLRQSGRRWSSLLASHRTGESQSLSSRRSPRRLLG